jgi:tRNA(fMet)-specific endonuclease VapC
MGTLVDTTVFIDLERGNRDEIIDFGTLIGQRLVERLGPDDEIGIAAITASELLHGVHRASAEHRSGREALVETVLSEVPVVGFDLLTARVHARIWAELAASGSDVGAHDRLVAATAITLGWRVATANIGHFERVPGLEVVEVH